MAIKYEVVERNQSGRWSSSGSGGGRGERGGTMTDELLVNRGNDDDAKGAGITYLGWPIR